MSNTVSTAAPTSGLPPGRGRRVVRIVGGVVVVLIVFGLGALWRGRWLSDFSAQPEVNKAGHEVADGHSHAHEKDGHDHSHEDNLTLVEVTRQARGNIGLQVGEVGFADFTRTITVPAIVVERPGRSQIAVVAPLTGVVTRIDVIPGQAIEPGQPLFALRLMHEELVVSQSEFLSTLEQLDVVNKEIKRLEEIAKDGAIAGKVVLEREYERQKLEAVNRAQDQALLLHGLTEADIEMPKDFATAVVRIKACSASVKEALKKGDVHDAHKPADELVILAGKLLPLARDGGVPKARWKEINVLAKELGSQLDKLHTAVDSDKATGNEAILTAIDTTITELEKVAASVQ